MKNIEVCTHGIYKTIGSAMGISYQLTRTANMRSSHPKHGLINAIHTDLIAAQVKVIQRYQKKGLI